MIEKNGVNILIPAEYDRLMAAVTKPDYQAALAVGLNTGMRYVELQRFQVRPEWYDPERRCIHLPKSASLKQKRKLKDRYVYINHVGINYLPLFFRARALPKVQQFNHLLKEWAAKAGLKTLGTSAKTLRKTWESWLAVSYPGQLDQVCMNQGHTNLIAMRHYLQLPFTDDEKREIRNRTAGWMGNDHGL